MYALFSFNLTTCQKGRFGGGLLRNVLEFWITKKSFVILWYSQNTCAYVNKQFQNVQRQKLTMFEDLSFLDKKISRFVPYLVKMSDR